MEYYDTVIESVHIPHKQTSRSERYGHTTYYQICLDPSVHIKWPNLGNLQFQYLKYLLNTPLYVQFFYYQIL